MNAEERVEKNIWFADSTTPPDWVVSADFARRIARELDEARECLREAIKHVENNWQHGDWSIAGETYHRWRKAAGEEGRHD